MHILYLCKFSEGSEKSENSENSENSEAVVRRRAHTESSLGLSGAQPEERDAPPPNPPPRVSGEGAEIGKGVCPRGAEADAPLPTRLLSGRALPARLGKPSGALGKFGKIGRFRSFGGGIKKAGRLNSLPALGFMPG